MQNHKPQCDFRNPLILLRILPHFIVRTPPTTTTTTPLFKGEGGGVNFDYLPWRGGIWKIKKGGGDMVQGQVFLKRGDWHFSYFVFSRFIIFAFRNYFTLSKILLCIFEEKNFFSAIIILWRKIILSYLKMNLKIKMPHKLR